MQNKFIAAAIATLTIAAFDNGPAYAGGYAPGCTTVASTNWRAIDTSAAKATSLGYAVSKTKLTGTCHEIYATKEGQKFELFFNPVTNDLVHTAAK